VLRYYGHERVRVLDGGLLKWQAEGRPLSGAQPAVAPAVFTPRTQPALRRSVAQVLAALGGDMLLIDARNEREFCGEESRAARGGHIPGARNVFYQSLLSAEDHTFAAPAELRAHFAAAGIDLTASQDREVVVYCNGGVSATPVGLAYELATGRRAALYDGSWNEWGNDESKPIA
ncbi:MAG: sulfurtransferase, partial [Oscillochloris sp.]|nr:sulfurtransferase [Oscillochloris sp.]